MRSLFVIYYTYVYNIVICINFCERKIQGSVKQRYEDLFVIFFVYLLFLQL